MRHVRYHALAIQTFSALGANQVSHVFIDAFHFRLSRPSYLSFSFWHGRHRELRPLDEDFKRGNIHVGAQVAKRRPESATPVLWRPRSMSTKMASRPKYGESEELLPMQKLMGSSGKQSWRSSHGSEAPGRFRNGLASLYG